MQSRDEAESFCAELKPAGGELHRAEDVISQQRQDRLGVGRLDLLAEAVAVEFQQRVVRLVGGASTARRSAARRG